MELTLKRLLEQAEFTKASRGKGGYDVTEVDEFLDRASAMAAKVEVQLTQALDQAANAASPSPAVDVEAEVEARVAARLAAQPKGPSEEESAEQVRRTIVLAQRTADAAVREAREDAEKLLADARERAATLQADAEAKATSLVADAEAKAAATIAEGDAQATRERREARQRLAGEIAELEGIRESLRSDVTVLERHVEEQRGQLGSAIAELQRLLEDPSGFRMAPVPALLDPELPDLAADRSPEPAAAPAPEPAATPAAPAAPPIAAPAAPAASAPAAAEAPPAPEPGPEAERWDPSPPAVDPVLVIEEIDHEAPGRRDVPVESGPPTAPVAAVDLGLPPEPQPEPEPAPVPPVAAPSPPPVASPQRDDDAFLAELRKAMADDEPLGPRDAEDDALQGDLFDEDRRSWRFGRRK